MPDEPGQDETIQSPRRIWLKRIGMAVGLGMFAAAIAVVWQHREMIGDALNAVQDPSWPHVAMLLGSVVGNLILTSFVFSALYARYGKVGLMEMQCLIAGATLLNFLPMRPGMFGRMAYHKKCNGIRMRDSAKVIAQGIGIGAALSVYLLVAAWIFSRNRSLMWPLLIAPLPGLAILMAFPRWRLWAYAGVARYVDLLLWAVRYSAAFALLGLDLPAEAAICFSAVSATASLVPFVSNGLGVREWAVGLLAPVLADQQLELGITAELVNRAGEIVVIAIIGSVALAIVAKKLKPPMNTDEHG